MQPILPPPGPALALLAVGLACLQWILGRWRDLSPAVVGLVAASLALDRGLPTGQFASLAGIVCAFGIARSASADVARPELGSAVLALSLPGFWAFHALGFGEEIAGRAAAGWSLILGFGGCVVAFERRPGAPRVRWVGRIPVEQGPSAGRKG